MITIYCLPAPSCAQYAYLIASQLLLADAPIPSLGPFATPLPPHLLTSLSHPVTLSPRHLVTYTGPAWIGNAWRHLTCRHDGANYWLSVEGIAQYTISAAGDAVRQLAPDPASTAAQRCEALLGPALILALALRGIFCLHASAVVADNELLLFLGPSGSGKSTLVAYLHEASNWRRAADDIVPLRAPVTAPLVGALPHFPQLKLDALAQPALSLPQAVPVKAIYTLDEPTSEPTIQISPLGQNASLLQLIRHTVAARLFGQNLLAAHMAFCAAVARKQPLRRLSYPRRRHVLSQLHGLIGAEIAVARP